jgi:glycosyltransferase involved in cell wall biosynthesis
MLYMITVIIPSYNSENTIEDCLVALENQSFNENYEIILVDSSTDNTPRIVENGFPEVKLIHLPQKTDPGTARNLGLKESGGEIILFIDSDCIASTDWIERMVSLHRHTDYMAIGGGVLNGNDPTSDIAWAGYMAEFREFIPEQPRREVTHIPTCNISYKRQIFREIGGFNPDYYPQEDLEFNYRLIGRNGKILFSPDVQVRHNHRTTLDAYLKHQKRVGLITSRMLKILPLEGSSIVRNKLMAIVFIPFLPVVKWLRTVQIFWKLKKAILIRHPLALLVFAVGLIPWTTGFFKGIFIKENFKYKK